ncbi:MAG: MbnP family protein [Bacteroidia bacterium]
MSTNTLLKGVIVLCVIWINFAQSTFAQNDTTNNITFQLCMQGEALELEKGYAVSGKTDSVQITRFRFYLSNIRFVQNGLVIDSVPKQHILIDAENGNTFSFLSPQQYDSISFQIGIDSLTNVSGALGGDLDPTKGMYWSWQSGYINMKLEGRSALCPTRNKQFQFHIGGYSAPFNMLQYVMLPVTGDDPVTIKVEVEHFLQKLDLKKTHSIMSPNTEALQLSQLLPTMFSVEKM